MPKLKDGTDVYLGNQYLDARARDVAAFRAAEAAGRVRVQREVGDLNELVVTVAPETALVGRRRPGARAAARRPGRQGHGSSRMI